MPAVVAGPVVISEKQHLFEAWPCAIDALGGGTPSVNGVGIAERVRQAHSNKLQELVPDHPNGAEERPFFEEALGTNTTIKRFEVIIAFHQET